MISSFAKADAKLKVTPKDNETSKALMAGAKENIAKLKGLKGAEFDKAYVDHEVTYHVAVADAIDKTLIPNAEKRKVIVQRFRWTMTFQENHNS